MKHSTSSSDDTGIMSLAGLLAFYFVILKLNPGGYMDSVVQDWPWSLVFGAILASWGILLVILFVICVIYLVAIVYDDYSANKR